MKSKQGQIYRASKLLDCTSQMAHYGYNTPNDLIMEENFPLY